MVATVAERLPDLSGRQVLVLDDDTGVVRALLRVFRALGAHVRGVGTLREARLALDDTPPDAVLADLRLREDSGLDLLPEYLARQPDGAFYLMTGFASVDSAIEALRHGARHYYEKPLEPIALAREIADDLASPAAVGSLAARLEPWFVFADPVTARALADVPRIAQSAEPLFVEGEHGSGKRLVARAVHGLGPRADGPFVPIGPGGARQAPLPIERAVGGTLSIEEIGALTRTEQGALLDLLERGEGAGARTVRAAPVTRATRRDVRLIAGSTHPLDELVAAGALLEDLRYRLDVLEIRLPPLRARTLDIPPLATRAFASAWREHRRPGPPPLITTETMLQLARWPWHGNVRELGNVMTRLAVTLPDGVREIDAVFLEPLLEGASVVSADGVLVPSGATLAEAERLLIDATLRETGYHRSRAARQLGIGERTLRRKLNER